MKIIKMYPALPLKTKYNGSLHVNATRVKGLPKWERSKHVRLPPAPAGFERIYKRWTRFLLNIDRGWTNYGQITMRLPPLEFKLVGVDGGIAHYAPDYWDHPVVKELQKTLRANLKRYPTLRGNISIWRSSTQSAVNDSINDRFEGLIVDKRRSGDCSICLDKFNMTHAHVLRLPCRHYFHRHCVSKWLTENDQPQCPLCRADFAF